MDEIRRWFEAYTSGFSCEQQRDQYNLDLKMAHTGRVVDNALAIARAEGFEERAARVAEAAALLHDTGRWPQYARHRTFRDSESVNHGALGADEVMRLGALDGIDQTDAEAVLHAVRYHNAFHLAHGGSQLQRLALMCVRDADKLDVWAVLADYYDQPAGERSEAVGIGLADKPEYSVEAAGMLMGGKVVMLSMVRTLNDLKLMQLSWVHDLNFRSSFGMLLERGLLERIGASLPIGPQTEAAIKSAIAHASSRAGR